MTTPLHHEDGYATIITAALDALNPPPRLSVSAWSDQHRILPTAGSSEPGQWRTSRTPYLREIMDCLSSDHPARRIIFMKAAQLGASEALLNATGHFIGNERAPLLIVQPSHEMAERFSKQRLAPMIDDSPALRERIAPARQRDSGNTLFSKTWPGGIVVLAGANSPASLRSMPAKFVFADEVDGYPGDLAGEGDPVSLAEARSTAFPGRKLLLISTPTINSLSRIQKEFEASDQRRYFVPCPECKELQTLQWENLNWPDGKPHQAAYCCEHCGCLISERHKAQMLRQGQWRAAYPDRDVVGFHLNALYSAPGLGHCLQVKPFDRLSRGNWRK
jgi:phage terminase large subunit GpA-like protein